VIYNASYVMWSGGYSVGPRHLIPMLPFFAREVAVFFVDLLRSVLTESGLPGNRLVLDMDGIFEAPDQAGGTWPLAGP
jgi:hypothetical protein